MSPKSSAQHSPALSAARQRFDRWRRQHRRGARLPQELWRRAATLACTHGLNRTARALGLNYDCLKRRLAQTAPAEVVPATAPQDFIELVPPDAVAADSVDCTIEWVEGDGATVRMHLQGVRLPALTALARVLRSGPA